MVNMATMAADEGRIDAQELLGHQVGLGSREESDLHDFYADGCTPAEAVAELLAQAELARAA